MASVKNILFSKYLNLKLIGFGILLVGFYACKNAQNADENHPFCASEYCSASGKEELINLYKNNEYIKDTIYFNINCIVATKNSPAFFKIESKIHKLNHIFGSSYIQFKLLPLIPYEPQKYNLDEIEANSRNRRLVTKNLEKTNAINLFIVPHGKYLNGFTLVIPEKFSTYFNLLECNTTFISDEAWFNQSTLEHEFGHFFGLQHTFGKSPSENTTLEKPDGSNCLSEGDFICDTPADPNGKINSRCEFIGLSDKKMHNFNPLINNYMSYYQNACKNEFTEEQKIAMNVFANKYRNYLKIKK